MKKLKLLKTLKMLTFCIAFLISCVCVSNIKALTTWKITQTSVGKVLNINIDDVYGLCRLGWMHEEPKHVVVKGKMDYCDLKELSTLCSGFKTIDLSGVQAEVIPFNSFTLRKNLEKFVCPANLKAIEFGSFNSCPNLKEVIIPKSLVEIGDGCFQDCKNLEMKIPAEVKFGHYVFDNSPKVRICDTTKSAFSILKYLGFVTK
jgi:hypothetical protein